MDEQSQLELFAATAFELNPRSVQDIMAWPFFSLSKPKRLKPIKFTSEKNDIQIKVSGNSEYGIANIYDADILLWACAQVRHQYENTGKKPPRTVEFLPSRLVKQTGRKWGGQTVEGLKKSLQRMASTLIETSIRTEHIKEARGFHWIENYRTEEDRKTGDPSGPWSITLSEWLYEGILQDQNLLSLNPGYYAITSGLEKRLYQIARKHGGSQIWGVHISMKALHAKVGSGDSLKQFAWEVRRIAKERPILLDYTITVTRVAGEEKVWFRHEKFGLLSGPARPQ